MTGRNGASFRLEMSGELLRLLEQHLKTERDLRAEVGRCLDILWWCGRELRPRDRDRRSSPLFASS